MITGVFSALATTDEIKKLWFRDVDPSRIDEPNWFNTGLGELFKIKLVDDDFFHHMYSRDPVSPEGFFERNTHDLSPWNLSPKLIISLCKKYQTESINHVILAGDTMVLHAKSGETKLLGRSGNFIAYLGMVEDGRIWGETAAERKTIRECREIL